MTPTLQLTLDGREVDPLLERRRNAPLSHAQQAILAFILRHGSIRSVEAGTIVHDHRGEPAARRERLRRESGGLRRSDAVGCCRYAATDGRDAMNRLEERGLVRRGFVAWELVPADDVE